LMNDIDLTSYLSEGGAGFVQWGTEGWLPVGDFDNRFDGILEGNNHTISGLWINRPTTDYIGLFGIIDISGVILNLHIDVANGENIIGREYVGVLTGVICGIIDHCSASGNVAGTGIVGGLIGYGETSSLTQKSCFYGNATGIAQVGGIAGCVYGDISTSFSTGTVEGVFYIGGFSGQLKNGAISDSYSRVNVTRTSEDYSSVGGFVGENDQGTLYNCYSTGWVKQDGTILASKGFCGSVKELYLMNGNLWDSESSGATTTAGNATGKTTAEMIAYTTFINEGWDFMDETTNGPVDNWGINREVNDGYPFLAWQGFTNYPVPIEKENVEVKKTNTQIQIDGNAEDFWDFVDPVAIARNFSGELPTVEAYWKALWCDSGLYVLLSVQDDDHWPAWEVPSDFYWEYDWTNIFFDVNEILRDERGTKDAETGHYQTYFAFREDEYGTPVCDEPSNGQIIGGTHAYSLSSNDYIVEHFFPFGNFQNLDGEIMDRNSFLALDEIGFDVNITDQDEGITLSRQRKVWQSDGTIDECWNSMDGCGTITLTENAVEDPQLSN
ncbi:MAG TPA: sugar-binding protein, partial [Prolixibacteraceae bacterium]|nr:sugar-binding protein [Prolixibacteraceae bacterium]